RDINLDIRHGQIVCIIGPSGCGKSTLLRMIGGLERPTAGEVLQTGALPEGCLNPLTYIFQDFALLPWRTVEKNVSLVLEDHPLSGRAREAIIADVLARTKLSEFRSAYPRQLSGGMKQRVAIARALAVRPAVLLMDEPLSALDSQTRELLMDDLVDLWEKERYTAAISSAEPASVPPGVVRRPPSRRIVSPSKVKLAASVPTTLIASVTS